MNDQYVAFLHRPHTIKVYKLQFSNAHKYVPINMCRMRLPKLSKQLSKYNLTLCVMCC